MSEEERLKFDEGVDWYLTGVTILLLKKDATVRLIKVVTKTYGIEYQVSMPTRIDRSKIPFFGVTEIPAREIEGGYALDIKAWPTTPVSDRGHNKGPRGPSETRGPLAVSPRKRKESSEEATQIDPTTIVPPLPKERPILTAKKVVDIGVTNKERFKPVSTEVVRADPVAPRLRDKLRAKMSNGELLADKLRELVEADPPPADEALAERLKKFREQQKPEENHDQKLLNAIGYINSIKLKLGRRFQMKILEDGTLKCRLNYYSKGESNEQA